MVVDLTPVTYGVRSILVAVTLPYLQHCLNRDGIFGVRPLHCTQERRYQYWWLLSSVVSALISHLPHCNGVWLTILVGYYVRPYHHNGYTLFAVALALGFGCTAPLWAQVVTFHLRCVRQE